MKPILTKQQKDNQKALKGQLSFHNGILSAINFGTLSSWQQLQQDYNIDCKDYFCIPFSRKSVDTILEKQRTKLENEFRILESSHSPIIPAKTPVLQTKAEVAKVADSVDTIVNQQPSSDLFGVDYNSNSNSPSPSSANLALVPKDELNADNNYGFVVSPNEDFEPTWYQKKAITQLHKKIVEEQKSGVLLLSTTGSGKTFMVGGLHRRLLDIQYENNKTWSHIPYLYITRTTVVEQAKRVFKKHFRCVPGIDIEIINVEQLRSKGGAYWLKRETVITGGEVEEYWKWKPRIHPCIAYFDESQAAKNKQSTQTEIMCAYSQLENATLVSISATPFTRVSEAKCFAISTKRPLDHFRGVFPLGSILNEHTWPAYSKVICGDFGTPEEYNEAAVARLMDDLKDYVVRVKGITSQFKGINNIKIIPFQSEEARKFYFDAYDRLVKEMAKAAAESEDGEVSAIHQFTILLKYSMAAELSKADLLAGIAFNDVKAGKAALIAVKFKGTIIKIVQLLTQPLNEGGKYGVSRDKISLVWGGGQTQLTEKQKQRKKIKELGKKLEDAGMTADEVLADLDLDEVEDRELQDLPAHLRLGPQSMDDRQIELDKFQVNESDYLVYTYRSGGVGLSAHHTDEFTTDWNRKALGFDKWYEMIQKLPEKQRPKPGKVRLQKESRYAYLEDIPFIPTKQRKTSASVTYNAIEMVQVLGRGPRQNSLSDTEQNIYLYQGTIEVEIYDILVEKLKCLKQVVRMNESWQDILVSKQPGKIKQKLIESTQNLPVKDEDEGEIGDIEE